MQEGYFKVSWSDIKNSPGWFGKICLLGLIQFIPVFGSIVTYGYAFGWARDIAWDVHRPMPERIFGNEDNQLYSRGFFAWLFFLIVSVIVGGISAINDESNLLSFIAIVLQIALTMFVLVCIMRSAIYGRLGAGFQLNRVWAMIKHDPKGLARIMAMTLLVGLIMGVVWGIVFAIVLTAVIIAGMGTAGLAVDWEALADGLMYGAPGAEQQLATALGILAPVIGIALILILLLAYVLMVGSSWLTLLQARAMGYWTRGFDVPHWGGQDDPMPFELQQAVATQQAAAQYVAQQQAAQQAAQQAYQQQPAQGVGQAPAQYVQQNPYAAQNPYEAGRNPYATSGVEAPQQPFAPPVATAPIDAAAAAVAPAAGGQAVKDAAVITTPPVDVPAPAVFETPAIDPVAVSEDMAEATAIPASPADAPAPAVPVASAADELLDSASETAPAYQGRPVSAAPQAEVPLAPRWEKIDLDALKGNGNAEG